MAPTERYIAESWRRPGMSTWKCPAPNCELQVLTPGGLPTSHKCPHYTLEIRISWMSYGPSLLQQLWNKADNTYMELLGWSSTHEPTPEAELDRQVLRGKLIGYCDALALYMVPHFTTQNEIANEIVKRYQKSEAGEEYETAGLGSRTYEPPPGDHKLARQQSYQVKITLSREDQELVKSTPVEAGSDELMARMFKCSAAEIKAIRNSQS